MQIVNVQGSCYGGQFAINLGMQPISIPDMLGKAVDVRKTSVSVCEFNCRLSEKGSDQWWSHDGTETAMDEAVSKATRVYETYGRPSLARVSAADSTVYSLTPAELGAWMTDFHGFGLTRFRAGLVLARLRIARGDHEQGRAFASMVLAELSPEPCPLRKALVTLLEDKAGLN